MNERRFRDRCDAGKTLAARLEAYAGRPGLLVLALPRGGVPVAFEVAEALGAELDVFVVRKLGVPGHEEFAMGAIATGGVRVISEDVVRQIQLDETSVERVARREEEELRRREAAYRGEREPPVVAGRTVVLVDDGLATGSTMRAAVAALKQQGPEELVVAVPVGAAETCSEFEDLVDQVICAHSPSPFHAVGLWYEDFGQTSDSEVHELLDEARTSAGPGASNSASRR